MNWIHTKEKRKIDSFLDTTKGEPITAAELKPLNQPMPNNLVKRLLGEMTSEKKLVSLMVAAGIIMALGQWQLTVHLKDVFDALQSKGEDLSFQINRVLNVPKIIVTFAFIMVVGRYVHIATMNYLADVVTMKLRHKLLKKFMNLNQAFHQQYQGGAGGLISRVLNDVVNIQHGMRLIADIFTQPLTFILMLGTLFYFNVKLTSMILLILPPLLIFLRQISRSLRKYGHGSQSVLEKAAGIVKESLDGMRVIQSFGLESEMNRRFDSIAKDYLALRKRIHLRADFTSPMTEFIATSVIMGIFTYIGMDIIHGKATIGDFGAYMAALMALQSPIKKFQESFVKVQETLVSLERIYLILDDHNMVDESQSIDPFPQNWKEIHFKNLGFRYQKDSVLKNINFTIKKGEVVAIVGESGSGKSTLVNLIQRFFDPSEGGIFFDTVNLRSIKLKELRRNIGLVTQEVFLFSDSIERNINSGDFSQDSTRVQETAMAANAHDFISKMSKGYESPVGDRGTLLSGGERQRVSIARALFKNAPLLILDEATSALDSGSEVEVQKGLDRLMQGKTTIIIAHRLSTILHADKIIVMRNGQIVEIGKHSDLINQKGEYSRFIQLQALNNN